MPQKHIPVVSAIFLCLLAINSLLCLSGCGGARNMNSSSNYSIATGRATLTVRWPERGRLIPFAAESIRIRLTNGTKLLGEALLTRPENGGNATASFDRLPPGTLVATGTAYPNPDGTRVVQAQAQTTATILSGQTAQIRLTLQSTIDRLEVTPVSQNLAIGQSATLTPTAKNESGEIVFTLPATIEWRSLNPAIATVEAGGLIHAVANGTVSIEAKETESGKTGTAIVTVGGSSEEFVFNPANGHYYKIGTTTLPEGITWDAARVAANQAGGYLATITSAEENAFVFSLLGPDRYWRFNGNGSMGPWIGGYLFQDELGGSGWRWLNSETMNYTAWAANEPNNAWGNETKIQYQTPIGLPRAATWNDLPNDSSDNPISYVIEYDSNPVLP